MKIGEASNVLSFDSDSAHKRAYAVSNNNSNMIFILCEQLPIESQFVMILYDSCWFDDMLIDYSVILTDSCNPKTLFAFFCDASMSGHSILQCGMPAHRLALTQAWVCSVNILLSLWAMIHEVSGVQVQIWNNTGNKQKDRARPTGSTYQTYVCICADLKHLPQSNCFAHAYSPPSTNCALWQDTEATQLVGRHV